MTNFIKISIGVLLSIFVAILLWDNILLNYSNPDNVKGYYSEFKLSPYNNLFRFIIFTSLPIITYTILYKSIYKIKFNNFLLIFKNNFPSNKNSALLNYFLLLFFLLSFLQFFSADFSTSKVDYLHEGLSLSSGYNSKITGLFWSGSYISNSLFSDFSSTKFSWIISQKDSIGSLRVFHIFLRLITELTLIYFIFLICKLFNYEKNKEVVFFVILCSLSLYFNRELTEIFYPARYRDIPIILLFIFTFNLINRSNSKKIDGFIIGILSCASILWSFDRGIYLNAALLFIIFILLYKKKFFDFGVLVIGIIIGWLFFYVYFGSVEFKDFLSNAYDVSKDADLFLGLEYPKPFNFDYNEHASRGTRNLIIIIVNGIFIVNLILNNKQNIPETSKLFLLFIFVVSFINYKSGITRSDGYHMKQAIFFNNILLFVFILNFLINKLEIFQKQSIKKYFLFILFFGLVLINFKNVNYKNLINYKDRFVNYTSKSDDDFLSQEYIFLKNELNDNYDFNCIQLFSYDAILPYLLKNKFCTKYNYLVISSSNSVQNKFINQLKHKSPKYIIFNKNYTFIGLMPVEKKFDRVFEYINENYMVEKEISDWAIYSRN
tara:strand:- start:1216 stop:3030 length:1815 start_codon:yes stop_codon:yes gene_type:complete